jgi:hypothetical protein
MSAIIFKFFEEPQLIPVLVKGQNINKNNLTFVCKWCKEHNIRNNNNEICTANATNNTTSNLIKHLKRKDHETPYASYLKFLEEEKEQTLTNSPATKRKRLETMITPTRTLTNMGFVPYPRNSIQQLDR